MKQPSCASHDVCPERPPRRARRFAALCVASAWPVLASAQGKARDGGTAQLDFHDVFKRLDTTGLLLIALSALFILWFVWRIVKMIGRDRAPRPSRSRKGRAPRVVVSPTTIAPQRDSLSAATDWGFDENKRSAVSRRRGLSEDATRTSIDTSTRLPSLERPTGSYGVQPEDALGRSPVATVSPYRTGTNPYYLRGDSLENQIDVEEVADVLTQADLLVQLGDPKEAMNLLSRHIRETEKPGPQVWLMLLDLYRTTGREAQYNALGDGFRALFNAQVPPWSTSSAGDRTLEEYPQVLLKIQGLWPTPECRLYLEALLNDDRGGSRQGFSLTAYRDILFLVEGLEARRLLEGEDDDRADINRKLTVSP